MSKQKWTWAVRLAALMTVLCLASCTPNKPSGGENAGFAPKLDTDTDCSITVAGHYNNFEALETEFNRFTEFYPNVKLNYSYMDGYSKGGSKILSTALASNEAPDIFFTYPWMNEWEDGAEIFAAAENLADPKLGIDLSCVRKELIKENDGSVFSVPVYTTTYGMMVNEDIFAAQNIAVPKTYDELVAACEKLKSAGYESPVMGYSRGSDLLYPMFYPYFCAQIKGNDQALKDLNEMKTEAGEYMRSALELTADFMSRGFVDLESCDKMEDNYESVILRFFEGDVPMMLASGNTVSGTEKRETKSEQFTANPFKYGFYPVPSTSDGGYFVNTVSIGFGVNKNSGNLDMANEFMRFLVSTNELNLMAKAKRMVTPCVDMSLDSVYAPFQNLSAERFINLSELGLDDAPASQVSKAGWQVAIGKMSVDEAVAKFGAIE